jgi:hypothetical protein
MFAGEPPSSSDPTKRLRLEHLDLDAFRRLLLQIGGANIAGAGAPGSRLLCRQLGEAVP